MDLLNILHKYSAVFITGLLILAGPQIRAEQEQHLPETLESVKTEQQTFSTTEDKGIQDSSRIVLTVSEQEWLKAHPVIDIGVDGNWPPIDFLDAVGHHSGIAHEFLQRMSQMLGVRFNPVPGPTFNKMLNKVKSGQLKVGMTIVETPQRRQSLWFTDPYFTAHKIIVSRRSSQQFRSPNELSGKTVAMEEGYYSVDLIKKKYPNISLKLLPSTLDALNAVSWGQADAYIGNGVVVEWLINEYQIANLNISGQAGLKPSRQRFAVYKDNAWQPLVGIINKALSGITEAQRKTIFKKWVGFASKAEDLKLRIKLTETEYRWLKQHPDIRLGIDRQWPPVEFVDHKGQYRGLSSDFIKIFSQAFDVNIVDDTLLTWEQVIKQAREHRLDLLPAVLKTPAREKYLNFTRPYLNFSTVIFVNQDRIHTTTLQDLHGKKVGIEESYAVRELVHRDHPEIRLVTVKNNKDGLDQVALGKIDAYIGNLTTSSYLLNKFGISNVKVGGTTPYAMDLRMGVRKDWPELVSILNKYLNALSEEDIARIRHKWLTVTYDIQVDYSTIRNTIIIAGLLLLLSFSWIVYFRQKNTALQRSEEQLNQIINTVPLAIMMTDDNGTIIRANSFAEDLMKSEDTVVGQNITRYYYEPEQRKSVIQMLSQHKRIRNQQIYFQTTRNKVLKGLFSAVRVSVANREANLGVFVDLSDRIKMEEELKQAKEASEQASRFKSNFLANMSHEIRTPMNAIIGMTHLVLMTELTQKQLDYIRKIDISAHHLLVIINDILDISKIEAGKLIIEKTTFNLDEVLEHIQNLISLKATEKNLSVRFKKTSDVPVNLLGDPLRLGQVLLNLVQNAIKFTERGEVVVNITTVQSADNKIITDKHQFGEQADNHVTLHFGVSDTGIGIEPEKLDRLFEPFIQADNSISRQYGGTGLGLSISFQLVALMGGQLKVESQPGKGSIFSFSLVFEKQQILPLEDQLQSNNKPGKESIKELRKSVQRLKGKVLLVEDNKINQQVAQELLEGYGLLVVIADNGKQALELASSTDFDLILMDVQMPVMDGLEATRQLRQIKSYQYTPVIAMTAHAMDGDREACLQAGMNDYLSKPIDPNVLLHVLSNWLESYEVLHAASADVPADINLPDNIPGIDLAWGLKRVGGNKKLFIRLLNDFLQSHQGVCEKTRQFILNNNIEAARRQVHTIQGVAGNIGARDLQAAAMELEKSIRTGADKTVYQELADKFCRQARIVFAALYNLEQPSQPSDNNEHANSGAPAEIKSLTPEVRTELQQLNIHLQKLLLEGDPVARNTAGKILQLMQDYLAESDLILIRQMLSAIESYDFDAAMELLRSLNFEQG